MLDVASWLGRNRIGELPMNLNFGENLFGELWSRVSGSVDMVHKG